MKKHPPEKNSKYILNLFNKNKEKIPFPYNITKKIPSSQKIRDYQFEGIKTQLIKYQGITKTGEILNFYGHYSSKKTIKFLGQWLFLDYLAQNGFLEAPLLVPRPIFFETKDNFFIRESAKGDVMMEYLKDNNSEYLKKIVRKAAQWLLKFQKLKVKNKKIFALNSDIEKKEFNHYIKIARTRFSSKPYNTIRHTLDAIHKHTNSYDKNKNSTLVHGDFQPPNIIYDKKNENLTIIDFDWSGLGDPLSDIGNFMFQFEYHSIQNQYLTQKEVALYKKIFLDAYFKKQPAEQQKRRINIYQAKFAIQRAIFEAEFIIPKSLKPEDDTTVKNLIKKAAQNII